MVLENFNKIIKTGSYLMIGKIKLTISKKLTELWIYKLIINYL